MRKILVSTILGVGIAGTANASIVSSGFLDEKLTEMTNATTLQLDTKANQTDLTELSNIVAKSGWNTENGSLEFSSFPFTNEFGFESKGSWVKATKGIADMLGQYNANTEFPGLAGVTYKLTNGWTSDVGIGLRFDKYNQYNPGLEGMFNGWTIYNPSGSETMVFNGLENISSQIRTIENTYHTVLSKLLVNGENKINVEAYNYTGPIYPLWKLSEGIDKIGTLPSGNFPIFPGHEVLFYELDQPLTYPTSLAELITAIYGNPETRKPGLLTGIYEGSRFDLDHNGQPDSFIGIIPNYQLAKNANDKIGTLPSGNFPKFPGHEFLFPVLNQPLTYPTSLAELITAIYGNNSETGIPGLLSAITMGFPFDFDGDDRPETSIGLYPNYGLAKNAYDIADANTTKIGTVPDGKNLAGMISETDAKIGTVPDGKNLAGMISETDTKIGTLPAGYDSVGAALTAIKGIAEDAKAAALAAIPDPKQEGSSGKFVLTVDVVGDNATYHWEKIDHEGETTTSTE